MTNLHDDERPFAHPDMPEGMTQEEYAEWLHRHRDEPGWEQVEAEVSPNLATVVSVRLRRSELTAVANAAEAAGLKLSTFIRQAALSASSVVDLDAARRDLGRLRRQVDQLADHLGHDDRADRPAA
ncbi:MAG: plasmid mobilization protein [Natronosporangium sp.]